ncbi:MAG: spondin domain-containing protein [Pseudomonadota bacterium]|nr:spondin domain-containing protein [Pseudomonadota bacterium]
MTKKWALSRAMLVMAVLAVSFAIATEIALANGYRHNSARYLVTIVNLMRGQPLTPAVVLTHKDNFVLFVEGSQASPELIPIAEDADLEPMIASVSHSPDVYDVRIISGTGPVVPPGSPRNARVIRPGESAAVVVEAQGIFRRISLVGMLASTNDGFYALRGVQLPSQGAVAYYSPAWDAGSEANDEDCATIPGPPCGNFFVRNTTGAEEFVHIHAGIHGIKDLVPAVSDWRNPVAKITIQRIH